MTVQLLTISSQVFNRYITTAGEIFVSCPTGYKALIVTYNADGTYGGYTPNTGYHEGSFSVTTPKPYISIEVRKTDETALTASDVNASAFVLSSGVIANKIADIINDTQNGLVKTNKSLDIWGQRKINAGEFVSVVLPELAFLSNADLPLYTDGYNYKHYIDLTVMKNPSANTYTVTNQTELLSAMSNASSGDTIILKSGVYSPIAIEKSINLVADGEVLFVPIIPTSFAESSTAGAYSASMARPTAVYDITHISDGIIQKLTHTTNVSDLSNKGIWYYSTSNSKLYVHNFDSEKPTEKTIVCDDTTSAVITINGNNTVYLQGLTIIGGTSNILATGGDLICVDCTMLYANTNNAITMQATNGYFQRCITAFAQLDGFNYHKNSNDVLSYGLEVDCIGHDNGNRDSGQSNNGSTMHDGGAVVRIGGSYYNNKGGNIADISGNGLSYNYDCLAYDSTADTDAELNTKSDFWAYYGCSMYLYGCRGIGDSKYNLYANGNGIIYQKNCEFERSAGNIEVIS